MESEEYVRSRPRTQFAQEEEPRPREHAPTTVSPLTDRALTQDTSSTNSTARAGAVQRMQQTHGNRAVQRYMNTPAPMMTLQRKSDEDVPEWARLKLTEEEATIAALEHEKKHKGRHGQSHAHASGPTEMSPIAITADPPHAQQAPGDGGTYGGIVTGGSPWIEIPGSGPSRLPGLSGPNIVLPY
jgi:hypothetical protein